MELEVLSSNWEIDKYSNHLNTGLVWYLNGRFVSGGQMVRYSNGGLKIGIKKPVWFKMSGICLWSEMSGI